jgi:hypothetical protein
MYKIRFAVILSVGFVGIHERFPVPNEIDELRERSFVFWEIGNVFIDIPFLAFVNSDV